MVPLPVRLFGADVWFGRVGLCSSDLVQRYLSFILHSRFFSNYNSIAWDHADVMYVADFDILVLITISAGILLLTFLVGFTGTILNSRPILSVYALLLWPALASILAIGYTSYKRYAFSLDRKLNLAWSEWYTPLGRLTIQDSLHCCGFYSALHSVTPSKRCYSRTQFPGCKAKLYDFERKNLGIIWSLTFSLVPLHIFNIFVSLLCANHVTKTFGKGITPKLYWLSGKDLRNDAEKIWGRIREVGGVSPVKVPPQSVSRPPLVGELFRDDKVSAEDGDEEAMYPSYSKF